MVAVHGNDFAAGFLRLSPESLEEVENLNLIAATVEHVADLDNGGGSAGPVSGGVDEVGETERLLRLGKVAVEIADRDETARRGRVVGTHIARGIFVIFGVRGVLVILGV